MLLFMDGFDHYTGNIDASGKWAPSTGTIMKTQSQSLSDPFPRTGLGYANGYFFSDEARTPVLPVSGNGFVVGIAINYNQDETGESPFIRIREGTSIVHLQLVWDGPSKKLKVKNGAGTVLATGTTSIPINTWVYVEFKGTIADSGGTFSVRVDEIVESSLTLTGQDTRNGGTGQWDRVALTTIAQTWHGFHDDFYVCDQSGGAYDNFLGAIKLETLLPQTGNGTNVGLTPSTGTDHGALVDERPPNTSDYNGSATVGAKDTYNLPSMVSTGPILAIQTNLYAAKSDSGARKIVDVIRPSGGPDDEGTVEQDLATTFAYNRFIRIAKPGGGAWTKTIIDGMEAGMKVSS